MAKRSMVGMALLFLVVPAVACAAFLDDFYLARLGERGSEARRLAALTAGEPAQAERCLTPVIRGLKREWTQLEPATQKVLAKHVLRPTLPAEVIYPSRQGHFNIRYSLSGPDAPDLSDADGSGFPDWVEKVAAVFEEVYSAETGSAAMGYRPPSVARYDVYLRNLVPQSAYGFTSDDGAPTYPGTSSTSYIEIDRAFTDPVYTANRTYTPEQMLQITAAHEYHHAIQYGYNWYFEMWFAEATSTWIEDEIYDQVNQLYRYLPSYLTRTGSLSLNAPNGSNSEYGRWIFNRYLSERHSPAVIRDIWTRLAASAPPADGSDIQTLPVIDAVLKQKGSALATDFSDFAARACLRDWTTHTSDLGLIATVSPEASYSSYPVDGAAINERISSLPAYGFVSYRFLPAASAPADLVLTLPGVPAAVDVFAIKKGSDGSVDQYRLDRNAGTLTVPGFNTRATAEVQVVLCKAGSDSAPVTAVASGGSKGGGCFIATAAYGSYLHPKVAVLRAFRDRCLLTNAPGRLFVAPYYRLSPPVAELIGHNEALKWGVRAALAPLIAAVEHLRLTVLLAALLVVAWGSRLCRARLRRRAVEGVAE